MSLNMSKIAIAILIAMASFFTLKKVASSYNFSATRLKKQWADHHLFYTTIQYEEFDLNAEAVDGHVAVAKDQRWKATSAAVTQAESGYYDLGITKWVLPFINDSGVSGPFELIGENRFLFLSRCGDLSLLRLDGDKLVLERQVALPSKSEILCSRSPLAPLAGVKGMYYDTPRKTLYVSYEFEEEKNCVGLKISKFALDENTLDVRRKSSIFRTRPCIKKDLITYTQAGGVFAFDQVGLRLFFTVGDFGVGQLAGDLKSTYGAIWYFSVLDGLSRPYAFGSRNAQGLDYDQVTNLLFESEHGPKGGDEINSIEFKDNLGYPHSSYGLEYDHQTDKGFYHGNWGQHDFGKKPIYTFFPSEAVTGLKVYPRQSYFKDWGGDLIVTSLRGQSIFRIKIDDGRAVYSEPLVKLDDRLRSIAISGEGIIYVKADPNVFYQIKRAGDVSMDLIGYGKSLSVQCLTCHGASDAMIPNLYGKPKQYLLNRLDELSRGTSKSPMEAIASSLNPSKREALTTYFSRTKARPAR